MTTSPLLSANQGYALTDNLWLKPALRYRVQDVKDDLRGDALANTLKLRLSANWQASDNVSVFGELDFVHAFNAGNYNSVTLQRETSPIPDPEGQEINQFFLRYQSNADWRMNIGRQALNFDNERHVGTNGFWQQEQTFDAFNFVYDNNINWQVNYVYLAGVQTIFGSNADPQLASNDVRFPEQTQRPIFELGYQRHQSHLFNASYIQSNQFQLSAFAYLLRNQDVPMFSSNTIGLRTTGEFKPKQVRYAYEFEIALQENAANSPWLYQTSYFQGQLSAQFKSHRFGLNYERFGQNNGFSFATSLGSAHKFNGWADVFDDYFSRDGISDTFLDYRGRDAKLRWRVKLHQFNDVNSSATIGHEIDAEIAYRYSRKIELRLIAAKYFDDEGISRLPISQNNLSSIFASFSYDL